MTIAPGTFLGSYEILALLGAGGMGEVWRARDTRLGREVAVKILPRDLADNARLKVRLEREARAISHLTHPHICTLYDVGEEGGTSYLVMELVDGETLAHRLARGPIPLPDVMRFGAQIADALECAHRAGIIHRDLKPANIMITKSGVKLLDFGLAKAAATGTGTDSSTLQRGITEEGAILGTLQYMAPEQIEGVDADARTDIFALGVLLYEMTTGRPAFVGKTRTSVIAAIIGVQPPPVRQMQPLAPSALDHVIATCLEKDRDRRWQSAHDVLAELPMDRGRLRQRSGTSEAAFMGMADHCSLRRKPGNVSESWQDVQSQPENLERSRRESSRKRAPNLSLERTFARPSGSLSCESCAAGESRSARTLGRKSE